MSENIISEDGLYALISTSQGDILLSLEYEKTPMTVCNFVGLAEGTIENKHTDEGEPYYDGLMFHRVIPDFMIQGGCPKGNGTGGPGYTIKGEFTYNGVNNPTKHERGVISMARAMDPNSAGSQFFIMHKDAPHLDGQYAAFGKVTKGIEIVDKIASTKTDFRDKPLSPVIIESIKML